MLLLPQILQENKLHLPPLNLSPPRIPFWAVGNPNLNEPWVRGLRIAGIIRQQFSLTGTGLLTKPEVDYINSRLPVAFEDATNLELTAIPPEAIDDLALMENQTGNGHNKPSNNTNIDKILWELSEVAKETQPLPKEEVIARLKFLDDIAFKANVNESMNPDGIPAALARLTPKQVRAIAQNGTLPVVILGGGATLLLHHASGAPMDKKHLTNSLLPIGVVGGATATGELLTAAGFTRVGTLLGPIGTGVAVLLPVAREVTEIRNSGMDFSHPVAKARLRIVGAQSGFGFSGCLAGAALGLSLGPWGSVAGCILLATPSSLVGGKITEWKVKRELEGKTTYWRPW